MIMLNTGLRRPSKIVCVGRNYAAHARELGNDVPERPLLFLKPPSSIISNGESIIIPLDSQRVEHEGEIAVVIAKRARNVSEAEALEVVAGYAPLNDVTARDLQKLDVQFTRAKSFDTFCPIGEVIPKFKVKQWRDLQVLCRVNGEIRQSGRATDMVFGIPALIAYISRVMTLEPGDVIATGTPEGVGALHPDDVVEVELPGFELVQNPVTAQEDEVKW
jgi:2-keto-4-pentenoate hydratase/2-oxohepta-3-ene-1,7-dioic acid hydratase in catechol pathway